MGVTSSAGAHPGGTHFCPPCPHLMGSLGGALAIAALSTSLAHPAAGDPGEVVGCPPSLVWAVLGGPKHSLNE